MNFFNRNQFDEEEAWRIEQEEQAVAQEAKMQQMSARFDMRFNQKKSFISQYADTRYWVGILSWIPQIISAVAAFKGARVLIEWVPIPYFDYVVGIAVLVGLELAKRHWSDKFWDRFFGTKRIHAGAFSVNFTLLAISLFFSAFGFYFLVSDNSQEAKLMGTSGDPEAVAIQDQLHQAKGDLQAMIDDKSNYNSEGLFYYKLMPAKVAKEKQIAELTTTLREKHGIYDIANKEIVKEWTIRKNFKSNTGIVITIICEFIFEIMMAFCSFYDFKRWLIERRIFEKKRAGRAAGAIAGSNGSYQANGATPPNGAAAGAHASASTTPSGQLWQDDGPQPSNLPPAIAGDCTYPPSERTVVDPFLGAARNPSSYRVATSSYSVATGENGLPNIRAEIFIQALKNANSNISSWNSKQDRPAKTRNLNRYTAIYNEAAAELAAIGINVDDVLKKRTA